MKIAFIHLGRENLGIEYLSSILKNEGHDVKLFLDQGLFGMNDNVFSIKFLEKLFSKENKLLNNILDYDPDITAFSVSTSTYQWSVKIADEIKKKIQTKIIFGGIHPTLLPQECTKNPSVDFVIRGEAEAAFPELLRKLENNSDFSDVKNLCFKKDDVVQMTPLGKPTDLDKLPLPDKALFEKFVDFEDDYLLVTTRGCLYNCSFCCEANMNEMYKFKFFRRRSVSHVMKELRYMKKKYNFKRMMIQDDIFYTDKEWLKDFLSRLKEEINVPFRCQAHVFHFDEEAAKMLKEGGCYSVEFGIQSMNQELRNKILNRAESDSKIEEVFNICDKVNLHYEVDHIFALPYDKEEHYVYAAKFYSKFKFIKRIKCHYMTYFPELKITGKALEAGELTTDDIKKFNEGNSSTYFHGGSVRNDKRWKMWKDFENLFKILPLLSESTVNFILDKKLYKYMHFIPSIMIVSLQVVLAIKKKDIRFVIYINRYLQGFKKLFTIKAGA